MFSRKKNLRRKVKVELDLSYATKTDLKNTTGNFANLKSNVDKLDIDELKMYQVILKI